MKYSTMILLGLVICAAVAYSEGMEDATACQLPPERGPCRAHIPSYYYDSQSESCRRFIYGGCGGNANRFQTETECYYKCTLCHLPKAPGLCNASATRYFYNSKTGKCEMFIYNGCAGNANNFLSPSGCYDVCGRSSGLIG